MVMKSPPDGELAKVKQILITLALDGPMCMRQLTEKFGHCKSAIRNLVNAGCLETYMHFNPYYGEDWSRKEVMFYAVTGIPYITKRLPLVKQPRNYVRDKQRSTIKIPKYIAYLEKWGYEVTHKGDV
jgi:hypothetical protein